MTMEYDKINGDVGFIDSTHEYSNIKNPDIKYTSVTTLIHNYTQPFDGEFWSGYKAIQSIVNEDAWKLIKKDLLATKKINDSLLESFKISKEEFEAAKQEILDTWEEKKNTACERGTAIHAQFENGFYESGSATKLNKYGIGGTFTCEKGRTALDLEKGVYPEYLIYRESDDGILKIAGQIDCLVKDGNEITIVDFKGLALDTNIPTLNGWSTIENIQVGDVIFDKNGNPTTVINKSDIHHNPCYKIVFDNNDSIIADHEHKWEISFLGSGNKWKNKVMTTEELALHIDKIKNNRLGSNIPKILNPAPLQLKEAELPIDPYVLGCWLGDGSSACGAITNETNNVWGEIERRGYKLGPNIAGEGKSNMHTILGISPKLRKLNLLKNKHIPEIYQRASYSQRLDLLRGIMDTDGHYHKKRKRFVMVTTLDWQCYDLIKLLASLGIKATKFDAFTTCNGKKIKTFHVTFSTLGLNPFLSRNQDIKFPLKNKCGFRNIVKVEPVDTVPTQCLEVDSPTHTFLCTESMIVTHNTNAKIDRKSGFDVTTKKNAKMLYPLNNLDDCNFYHYTMQLSTYALMLQLLNPEFIIKDLILYHINHDDEVEIIKCDYLKEEVIRMLSDYKKKIKNKQFKKKTAKIVY